MGKLVLSATDNRNRRPKLDVAPNGNVAPTERRRGAAGKPLLAAAVAVDSNPAAVEGNNLAEAGAVGCLLSRYPRSRQRQRRL
jgi:hypothetical protein